jgi:hypothetical protein
MVTQAQMKLQPTTNFVIGIYTLRAVMFECITMEDVAYVRRNRLESIHGVAVNPAVCVYTKDEWMKGDVMIVTYPKIEHWTDKPSCEKVEF